MVDKLSTLSMLSLEGRIILRVALVESVIRIAMQMQLRLSSSTVKTNNYVLSMPMLGYMGTHAVVLQNTWSFSMSAYQEVSTLFRNAVLKVMIWSNTPPKITFQIKL